MASVFDGLLPDAATTEPEAPTTGSVFDGLLPGEATVVEEVKAPVSPANPDTVQQIVGLASVGGPWKETLNEYIAQDKIPLDAARALETEIDTVTQKTEGLRLAQVALNKYFETDGTPFGEEDNGLGRSVTYSDAASFLRDDGRVGEIDREARDIVAAEMDKLAAKQPKFGTIQNAIQSANVAIDTSIGQMLQGTGRIVGSKDLIEAGTGIQEGAKAYVTDPTRAGEITTKIASAIGGTLPNLATSFSSPLAVATNAVQMYESFRQDALENGANEHEADTAAIYGFVVGGVSEMVLGQVGKVAGVIASKSTPLLLKSLGKYLENPAVRLVAGFNREGLQELTEQFSQNVATNSAVPQGREVELGRGLWESYLLGGVVGGLTQGVEIGTSAYNNATAAKLVVKSQDQFARQTQELFDIIEADPNATPEQKQESKNAYLSSLTPEARGILTARKEGEPLKEGTPEYAVALVQAGEDLKKAEAEAEIRNAERQAQTEIIATAEAEAAKVQRESGGTTPETAQAVEEVGKAQASNPDVVARIVSDNLISNLGDSLTEEPSNKLEKILPRAQEVRPELATQIEQELARRKEADTILEGLTNAQEAPAAETPESTAGTTETQLSEQQPAADLEPAGQVSGDQGREPVAQPTQEEALFAAIKEQNPAAKSVLRNAKKPWQIAVTQEDSKGKSRGRPKVVAIDHSAAPKRLQELVFQDEKKLFDWIENFSRPLLSEGTTLEEAERIAWLRLYNAAEHFDPVKNDDFYGFASGLMESARTDVRRSRESKTSRQTGSLDAEQGDSGQTLLDTLAAPEEDVISIEEARAQGLPLPESEEPSLTEEERYEEFEERNARIDADSRLSQEEKEAAKYLLAQHYGEDAGAMPELLRDPAALTQLATKLETKNEPIEQTAEQPGSPEPATREPETSVEDSAPPAEGRPESQEEAFEAKVDSLWENLTAKRKSIPSTQYDSIADKINALEETSPAAEVEAVEALIEQAGAPPAAVSALEKTPEQKSQSPADKAKARLYSQLSADVIAALEPHLAAFIKLLGNFDRIVVIDRDASGKLVDSQGNTTLDPQYKIPLDKYRGGSFFVQLGSDGRSYLVINNNVHSSVQNEEYSKRAIFEELWHTAQNEAAVREWKAKGRPGPMAGYVNAYAIAAARSAAKISIARPGVFNLPIYGSKTLLDIVKDDLYRNPSLDESQLGHEVLRLLGQLELGTGATEETTVTPQDASIVRKYLQKILQIFQTFTQTEEVRDLKDKVAAAILVLRGIENELKNEGNTSTRERGPGTGVGVDATRTDLSGTSTGNGEQAGALRSGVGLPDSPEIQSVRTEEAPVAPVPDRSEPVPEGPGVYRQDIRPAIRVQNGRDVPAVRSDVRAQVSKYRGLDPVQRQGVGLILQKMQEGGKAFLLADGTGTGKSLQIFVAALEAGLRSGKPSLVVTQNANIINSFRTQAQDILGFKPADYDALVEFKTYSDLVRDEGEEQDYGFVAFDEAHNLKNGESQRSIQASKLKAPFKLFASATPGEDPIHTAYFISEVTGKSEDQIATDLGFEVTYQNRRDKKTGEDHLVRVVSYQEGKDAADIASSLRRMVSDITRQGSYLNRTYPFWGQIDNTFDTDALTEKQTEQQQKIIGFWDTLAANGWPTAAMQRVAELGTWVEALKADRILKATLADLDAGKQVIIVADKVNGGKIRALGYNGEDFDKPRSEWNSVMQKIVEVQGGKIPQTRGLYPSVIQALERELASRGIPFSRIYGGNPGRNIREKNDFQSGKTRVVIMTPESGGAGIDLDDQVGSAPRSMYIATIDWSAAILDQIFGRGSRRNSKTPFDVKFINFSDSENDVARQEKVEAKMQSLRALQARGGEFEEVDFSEAPASVGAPSAEPTRTFTDGELAVWTRRWGLDKGTVGALQHIVRTSSNQMHRSLSRLFLEMPETPTAALATFDDGSDSAIGRYLPDSKKILINAANQHLDNPETTVLHEVTHHLSLSTLRADPKTLTPVQKEAVENLQKLFRQVRKEVVGRGVDLQIFTGRGRSLEFWSENRNLYGLRDVEEFVSEALTNTKFQSLLKTIPADPSITARIKSAWLEFVSAILKLTTSRGMFRGSVLEKTLASALTLVENQVLESPADTSAVQSAPVQETRNKILAVGKTFAEGNPDRMRDASSLPEMVAPNISFPGAVVQAKVYLRKVGRDIIGNTGTFYLYPGSGETAEDYAKHLIGDATRTRTAISKLQGLRAIDLTLKDPSFRIQDTRQGNNSDVYGRVYRDGSIHLVVVDPVSHRVKTQFVFSDRNDSALLNEKVTWVRSTDPNSYKGSQSSFGSSQTQGSPSETTAPVTGAGIATTPADRENGQSVLEQPATEPQQAAENPSRSAPVLSDTGSPVEPGVLDTIEQFLRESQGPTGPAAATAAASPNPSPFNEDNRFKLSDRILSVLGRSFADQLEQVGQRASNALMGLLGRRIREFGILQQETDYVLGKDWMALLDDMSWSERAPIVLEFSGFLRQQERERINIEVDVRRAVREIRDAGQKVTADMRDNIRDQFYAAYKERLDAAYNALSPKTKELVDEARNVMAESGKLADEVDMQVVSDEGWRKIRLAFQDNWPRTFNPETFGGLRPKSAVDRARRAEMLQELVDTGMAEDLYAAEALLNEHTKFQDAGSSGRDFFANIERARSTMIWPESFYDYSPDVVTRFIRRFSHRYAFVKLFGQAGPQKLNPFAQAPAGHVRYFTLDGTNWNTDLTDIRSQAKQVWIQSRAIALQDKKSLGHTEETAAQQASAEWNARVSDALISYKDMPETKDPMLAPDEEPLKLTDLYTSQDLFEQVGNGDGSVVLGYSDKGVPRTQLGVSEGSAQKEIIRSAREALNRVNDITFSSTLANRAQRAAGIAYLSGIAGGLRDFIGNALNSSIEFGISRSTVTAMRQLLSPFNSFADATEKGYIVRDIRNLIYSDIMPDVGSHRIDKALDFASDYALYFKDKLDRLGRVTIAAASISWARSVAPVFAGLSPESRKYKLEAGRLKKLTGLEPEHVLEMQAEGFGGPKTREFVQRAVREKAYGYNLDQLPLFHFNPTMKFFLQFQRWGSQATRDLAKNVVWPMAQYVRSGGQRGDPMPAVRFTVFVAAAWLGMPFDWLWEFLFGRKPKNATIEEITNTFGEDWARGILLGLDRAMQQVVYLGILGHIGDNLNNVYQLVERSRWKNPMEPPVFGMVDQFTEPFMTLKEQGTLTGRDAGDFLKRFPLAKQLWEVLGNANSHVDLAEKSAKIFEARRDVGYVLAVARRFAKEKGIDTESPFGSHRVPKNESTPLKRDLEEALLSGDKTETLRLVSETLRGLDADARKTKIENLKSSIRAKHPIRFGNRTTAELREVFFRWAARRVPGDVPRFRELGRTYENTADALSLIEGFGETF
jgi:hypothetical protein